MTAGLPLMRSVLTPLAKSALLPLGLLAGMSAADVDIQKKIYEAETATLIISNEEVVDAMRIAKSFEESGLLIKGISEIIKNEAKEQKRGCRGMLLGTLGANLLGNAIAGRGVIRTGEDTIRAGENF